jgi:hypothetical protein
MQASDTAADDVVPTEGRDAFAAACAAFAALTVTLDGHEAAGWTHDQLEDHLQVHGRELLRLLLQAHLDLRALRERHVLAQGRLPAMVDADGIGHPKVEHGHIRHLATVFGTVRVTRCAHRASGARNLYPADAALNLPEHRHSYGLQQQAATEAVRDSFQAAQEALTRACGKVAAKRQIEQRTVAAAADIDAFYATRTPTPATDDTLLCISGWPLWEPSTTPRSRPADPTTLSPRPSASTPPATTTAMLPPGGAAAAARPRPPSG